MRRLRPAHATRLVAGLLGTFALTACAREAPEPTPPAVQPTPPIFRDAASETGLDFQHVSGASGEHYLPEIMGPGVALVDYDVDGDLDVYLLQGTTLGSTTATGETAERRDVAMGSGISSSETSSPSPETSASSMSPTWLASGSGNTAWG